MIDCSVVFPDYDRAEAHLQRDNRHRVEIRLYSVGSGTYATVTVEVDKLANFLEQLRREQGI